MPRLLVVGAALLGLLYPSIARAEAPRRPNIIFILADDLGYGDLGCYGQKQIRTPNLDRLAAQGMRFTQCYAGSTVCAPSRCCLMTGKHTGHAFVRGNALVPLRPGDVTVAEILKKSGYATGLVGKWGLGEPGTTGVPNRKGFDYFFGYLNQVHAHNYYPDYLWRNQEKVPLPGNVVRKGVAVKRAVYSPDLLTREAVAFIDRNKDRPFFLYLAHTLPHANDEAGNNGMEVPSDAPYSDRTWPQAQKNHAAMITRLDGYVGTVLKELDRLKLADDTIVLFTSDNGPHKEGGADPYFFHSAGPLRGYKRDLTEGGIREPMIVRWPGHVRPGSVSDQVWAFWDFLPTAAELASAKAPEGLDGISVVPTLLGKGTQKQHEFLYWEFHERGFQQAVRMGDWKAIRLKLGAPLELYDLKTDLGEKHNVAARHPDVVARIEAYLKGARTDSKEFPVRPGGQKGGWTKSKANPVLGGKLGTCFDVALLKEGPTFRMWFSWRPRKSIALVESKDGIHWNEPVIVLGPNPASGWEDEVNRPVVVKKGDIYHLWYTGQAKGHSWIGHAVSPDGKSWKRTGSRPVLSPEAPWEKVAVMCPHVLWDGDKKLFRMWYSAGDQYEPNAIGYATSPDGLTWTKHRDNPIFRPDPRSAWEKHKVTACQVVPHRNGFVMFYIGFRDENHAQIGLARSPDGISGWKRHAANPIIRPTRGEWDEDAVYKPFAIPDGRRWLLWYNGRRGSVEQIGLAIHPGLGLGF